MRESILSRLARLTVRSCLKPALRPTFPGSCAAALGQHRHPHAKRFISRPLLAIKPGGRADRNRAFQIKNKVGRRLIQGNSAR